MVKARRKGRGKPKGKEEAKGRNKNKVKGGRRMKGKGSEGERGVEGAGKKEWKPDFRETAETKHCLDTDLLFLMTELPVI